MCTAIAESSIRSYTVTRQMNCTLREKSSLACPGCVVTVLPPEDESDGYEMSFSHFVHADASRHSVFINKYICEYIHIAES